jgi:peptidoglycan-associated lipoprotein
MKIARFVSFAIVAALLVAAGAGCRKGPGYVTPLPGPKAGTVQDPGSSGAMSDTTGAGGVQGTTSGGEGFPMADPSAYDTWKQDAEVFKQYTVYFAYDSSALQGGEKGKATAVADYLKSHTSPRTAVKIEGHCDERGTEEYNRALGDRRALSLREELISMGIDPSRVVTTSLGEDRPAVVGSDESAWSKNRRGEFILLTEP